MPLNGFCWGCILHGYSSEEQAKCLASRQKGRMPWDWLLVGVSYASYMRTLGASQGPLQPFKRERVVRLSSACRSNGFILLFRFSFDTNPVCRRGAYLSRHAGSSFTYSTCTSNQDILTLREPEHLEKKTLTRLTPLCRNKGKSMQRRCQKPSFATEREKDVSNFRVPLRCSHRIGVARRLGSKRFSSFSTAFRLSSCFLPCRTALNLSIEAMIIRGGPDIPLKMLTIWTSTRKRTIETGHFLEEKGYRVRQRSQLSQLNPGVCEKKSERRIRLEYPDEVLKHEADPYHHRYPRAEVSDSLC